MYFVTKYNGAVLELGYEFVNVDSGEICTKASFPPWLIKDGKLVSLKKALPELDQKIREYVGKGKIKAFLDKRRETVYH